MQKVSEQWQKKPREARKSYVLMAGSDKKRFEEELNMLRTYSAEQIKMGLFRPSQSFASG